MGVRPPHGLTPYGHLRGLPQSFTRSQKERPLTVQIVTALGPPLVAIVLHRDDELKTSAFSHFPAIFRRKASSGTGAPNLTSFSFTTTSPIVTVFETRVKGIITPSTLR